jgi:hypothetical protein
MDHDVIHHLHLAHQQKTLFSGWNFHKGSLSGLTAGQLSKQFNNAVIRKTPVVLVVGAACSRDHFISRLQAAPTVCFRVTWTLWISEFYQGEYM